MEWETAGCLHNNLKSVRFLIFPGFNLTYDIEVAFFCSVQVTVLLAVV